MRYKQLSIRLPVSSYNRIQKHAVVQNVSMNNVLNSLVDEHINNENVICEVRRVTDAIAEMMVLAFPADRREDVQKIRARIMETKNGNQI